MTNDVLQKPSNDVSGQDHGGAPQEPNSSHHSKYPTLCGTSADGFETSCNLSKVATISAPKPVDVFLSEIGREARGVEWEEEERGGEKEREMLRAQLTCEPPTALQL